MEQTREECIVLTPQLECRDGDDPLPNRVLVSTFTEVGYLLQATNVKGVEESLTQYNSAQQNRQCASSAIVKDTSRNIVYRRL